MGVDTATELWSDAVDPSIPVYELALENGNIVEWSELTKGRVAIHETGRAALTLPIDTAISGASAAEVFLALAPDLPVPQELEELSDRQADMADTHGRLVKRRQLQI